MTVMILGGSGFIGSEVVKRLSSEGIETISYDIIQSNAAGEKTRSLRANILELQSINRIFFEYDVKAVIHLIGLPAINYCEKNPHFSFLLNVMSVQNTLEGMRKADINRVVFASSAAVYGHSSDKPVEETHSTNPTTVYGYHKLIAENAIKAYGNSYGIGYVILRLFNVYGSNPQTGKDVISIWIRNALKREPLVVKGPNKFRDFVHVNDLVQAFEKALASNLSSNVLNIGTGIKTTLREIADKVKLCFPVVQIKEELTPDDGTGLYANANLAKEQLGFSSREPLNGIEQFLKEHVRNR